MSCLAYDQIWTFLYRLNIQIQYSTAYDTGCQPAVTVCGHVFTWNYLIEECVPSRRKPMNYRTQQYHGGHTSAVVRFHMCMPAFNAFGFISNTFDKEHNRREEHCFSLPTRSPVASNNSGCVTPRETFCKQRYTTINMTVSHPVPCRP